MIVCRKHSFAVGYLYLDEGPVSSKTDILHYVHWTTPTPGVRHAPYRTIMIDLGSPLDALLGRLDRDTRYEIRRAGRDAIALGAEFPCTPALLERFCAACDAEMRCKSAAGIDRLQLRAACEDGALDVSWAGQEGGPVLVWHCHFRRNERAVLSYSVSAFRSSQDKAFRQLTGRANRRLHWEDIVRLKSQGLAVLDLGGWYEGSQDQELLRINRFKEQFGGTIVEIYNSIEARTWKGRVGMWLLRAGKGLASRG
jgi:hypothetical protein